MCSTYFKVFNAVFKEPATNSRNSAGRELPDQQYENDADFSQIHRESLTGDDAKFPGETNELSQQYEELHVSEEYANLDATDTMIAEMEDKEYVQVDTIVTMPDQMDDFYQEYYEFNAGIEQIELDSTGIIETEQSTTADSETPLLQTETMPDDTSILQIDDMPESPDQYEEHHVTKEPGNLGFIDTLKVETETKEYIQLDTTETMPAQVEGIHQLYYEFGMTTEQVKLVATATLQTDHNTTANNTSILQTKNKPLTTIISLINLVTALLISLSAAKMIASMWIMMNFNSMFNTIKYRIIYKLKYGNAKLVNIGYLDTVDI